MRAKRFFWFFISILVGMVLGMVYGWMINPVTYTNTTPDTLRADYKADYVLMVAEIYQKDQNIGLAARRLDLLGATTPLRQVQSAILTAEELGYSEADMDLLARLALALETWSPAGEGSSP